MWKNVSKPVAEDSAAIGDRHIGRHGAIRAPVVAFGAIADAYSCLHRVWVIADADGRLQADMAF